MTDILSVEGWLAVGVVVSAAVADVIRRKVPDWLLVGWLLVGVVGWAYDRVELSAGGFLAGLAIALMGGLRRGDLKAAMVLGLFMSGVGLCVSFILAFLALVSLLVLREAHVVRFRPLESPFMPFLAVPVCVMVWLGW